MTVDYMRRASGGVTLDTPSYTVLTPTTQKIVYVATKVGIVNMTKTTAGELVLLGIRVNCVVPGLIQASVAAECIAASREKLCAQIVLQRFEAPSDVSRVYTFLASDVAVLITGIAIEVSGRKLCVQDIGVPWGKQIRLGRANDKFVSLSSASIGQPPQMPHSTDGFYLYGGQSYKYYI